MGRVDQKIYQSSKKIRATIISIKKSFYIFLLWTCFLESGDVSSNYNSQSVRLEEKVLAKLLARVQKLKRIGTKLAK